MTTPTQPADVRGQELETLRSQGWRVAVHNDYKLNGDDYTFWLLTHPNGRWIKGEGRSDEDAICVLLDAARASHPAPAVGGEVGERVPQAVIAAAERVRADASDTMFHNTTSDLSARLMCRVDVSALGLVMAWVDQAAAELQRLAAEVEGLRGELDAAQEAEREAQISADTWLAEHKLSQDRLATVTRERDEALAQLTEARSQVERWREAAGPFLSWAADNVAPDPSDTLCGIWAGNRCERERIVDWFGPTDFRRLAALASTEEGEKGNA
jgi:multidrug efflux pump subunit AcrA (membrane-fusion protein)